MNFDQIAALAASSANGDSMPSSNIRGRFIVAIFTSMAVLAVASCGGGSGGPSGVDEASGSSANVKTDGSSADVKGSGDRMGGYVLAGWGDVCVSPVADVVIQPGESIQAAVDANAAGTSFLLAAGIHRLQSVAPKTGDEFYGERDVSCKRLSTMNGARLLTGWTQQGNVWLATGQDQQGQVHGSCEAGWERCNHPEDLYFNDIPLRHVSAIGDVAPGAWHFDYAADTVYLGNDPAGHSVELGTARVAFAPSADNVRIVGLVVEKYAIPAQMGAIGDQYPAMGWHIDANDVRLNHGVGIKVGSNSVVTGNRVHDNGQLGVGANGSDVLFEGNEIYGNNNAHYSIGWEGGGSKFAKTSQLIVRGNCVHDNRGPGLWTDIDNIGTLYEENIVFGNMQDGIFHEISFDAIIRNNLVGQNGEDTRWLYGSQILISTSKNVEVYGNRIEAPVGFGHGISVIWQDRASDYAYYKPTGGNSFAATGNNIYDNDVTFLSDAEVWNGSPSLTGIAADFSPASTEAFLKNTMNGNSYHMLDPSARHFFWDNGGQSFSQVQALGQESNGSVDAEVTALEWSCALTPPSG